MVSYSPSSLFYRSAKATGAYEFADDPFRHRWIAHDGMGIDEAPSDRAFARFKLEPGARLPLPISDNVIFLAYSWWPVKDFPPPRFLPGTATVLSDVAKSPNYRVHADQVLLDDRWCHVLEHPGHDVLWLDLERGCALVARELMDSATGRVVQRIECFEHREVLPGVWAPMKFRNIIYDVDSDTMRISAEALFAVSSLTLNQAPPSGLLDFHHKPGMIQIHDDGRAEQIETGGHDLLEEVVDHAQRFGQFRRTRTLDVIDAPGIIAVNATSAIFVCAFMLWRRLGRARGRVSPGIQSREM